MITRRDTFKVPSIDGFKKEIDAEVNKAVDTAEKFINNVNPDRYNVDTVVQHYIFDEFAQKIRAVIERQKKALGIAKDNNINEFKARIQTTRRKQPSHKDNEGADAVNDQSYELPDNCNPILGNTVVFAVFVVLAITLDVFFNNASFASLYVDATLLTMIVIAISGIQNILPPIIVALVDNNKNINVKEGTMKGVRIVSGILLLLLLVSFAFMFTIRVLNANALTGGTGLMGTETTVEIIACLFGCMPLFTSATLFGVSTLYQNKPNRLMRRQKTRIRSQKKLDSAGNEEEYERNMNEYVSALEDELDTYAEYKLEHLEHKIREILTKKAGGSPEDVKAILPSIKYDSHSV